MEFLSPSHRRSSSQNVASSEEQGEMAVIAGYFPRYQFHIPSNTKFQRKPCHIQWLPGNYLHISVHDNLRKEKPPRGRFPSLLRRCYPVHKYPKRRENKHSMQNIPDFLWGKHPYPHPIPQKNSTPKTISKQTELQWVQRWQLPLPTSLCRQSRQK